MLFELSPEQEKLIPFYREKWKKIALSTEAIDRQKAREAVERGYINVGKKIPEIVFCDTQMSIFPILKEKLRIKRNIFTSSKKLQWNLLDRMRERLSKQLQLSHVHIDWRSADFLEKFKDFFWHYQEWLSSNQIAPEIATQGFFPEFGINNCCIVDFYFTGLQYPHSRKTWQSLESIAQNCGFVFGFADLCIIGDRPNQLNYDDSGYFHAEGKPAVEFNDGHSFYFYHGELIPEKYGKYHPDKWSLTWFWSEQQDRLKKILACGLNLVIENINSEQEKLLVEYRKKWINIFLSTQEIDRNESKIVVEEIYLKMGKRKPNIIFCDSLKKAIDIVKNIKSNNFLNEEIDYILRKNLDSQIHSQTHKIHHILCSGIVRGTVDFYEINELICAELGTQGFLNNIEEAQEETDEFFRGETEYKDWIFPACYFDFCISVLKCLHDPELWDLYQNMVLNCGWIFPYEDVCLICDRPRILSFDAENRPHAEGKPAIAFADGFSVYAYHGVRMPEKYGKYPPSQWRSQWILSEANVEIRRALIQGIGYGRICQELQAVELDNWREYSLLKIDVEFAEELEEEPIYLLKMTCPSTRHIHVLRVPPNMNSAREAISWVNWDIDPEEFSVQT